LTITTATITAQLTMSKVLPLHFKAMFIVIEPVLTFMGAWSAFTAPEWYLASQLPGPTITGLLHTQETNMLVRLYGVLLVCLASVSLAVFPVIANNTDRLSFSIARRLLFVLAGELFVFFGANCSWGCRSSLYCWVTYWGEGAYGCGELE
jgi:hypothetical protein